MTHPKITIVVVPRERFSYTQQSLESIYEHTTLPFKLVYVDGGSPKPIQRYLETQAQQKGFHLIRTEHYLAPNQARNLGLAAVDTEYLVFIDNDVHVAPGWLEQMIECAEDTNATIVCPLTCIGQPLHQKVHLAGGEAHIALEVKGEKMRRRVHEKHYFVNRLVVEVQEQLRRRSCEFAEFHCMLARRDIFDAIGPLDEKLLNTREHIDFCMTVAEAGGTIYCEPAAVVTYVPDRLYRWSDLSFFMLRWSDAWELSSLQHFRDKWDLKKDKYFKKRYGRLGHRRHKAYLKPLAAKLTFGHSLPWVENALIALERVLNRLITDRYARRYPHLSQQATSAAVSQVQKEVVPLS